MCESTYDAFTAQSQSAHTSHVGIHSTTHKTRSRGSPPQQIVTSATFDVEIWGVGSNISDPENCGHGSQGNGTNNYLDTHIYKFQALYGTLDVLQPIGMKIQDARFEFFTATKVRFVVLTLKMEAKGHPKSSLPTTQKTATWIVMMIRWVKIV